MRGDGSMNTSTAYVISLPQEAQELLVDNGVDLVAALRSDGLNVNRGPVPTGVSAFEGGKEVVLTLLAVGLTAPIVASAVAKILDALGRNKKFLVTEHELAPVLDTAGKPINDAAGDPVMYWSEKKRLVEASQVTQDKGAISAEVRPTMLKFSVSGGK
jgi:hypothetical protein